MSKQFEELSKNLATGMSRRKAFLRFGSGLGVVALGFFTRKPAAAEGRGDFCDAICKANDDLFFPNHGQCVDACVHSFGFNK